MGSPLWSKVEEYLTHRRPPDSFQDDRWVSAPSHVDRAKRLKLSFGRSHCQSMPLAGLRPPGTGQAPFPAREKHPSTDTLRRLSSSSSPSTSSPISSTHHGEGTPLSPHTLSPRLRARRVPPHRLRRSSTPLSRLAREADAFQGQQHDCSDVRMELGAFTSLWWKVKGSCADDLPCS